MSIPWPGMTHKTTAQSQSTYKGYIIPSLLLHCPSPILSLPGYNTGLPQQKGDVGAISKSNSLLHYKKRKRICHGPLCLLYGSLVVWGTHVTLRHRERARVRVVTQPPTLGAVEQRGLARPPIHPSPSSSSCKLNWFKVCTFIMRNQQSAQQQEGSHVVIRELR